MHNTNQSGQCYESIKLCKIGFPLYIKMDQSETRAGTFLRGVHFWFVYLIKVSPFSILRIGDTVVIGLVVAIFCCQEDRVVCLLILLDSPSLGEEKGDEGREDFTGGGLG